MTELSEKIRENIENIVKKSRGNLELSPKIEHMLIQVCYEMYKCGLRDGHRMCIKCLEVAKENIDM